MNEPNSSLPARTSALLLAAGSGNRLGGQPKAFLSAGGVTLVEWAIHRVRNCAAEILVGLRPEDVDHGQSLVGTRARVVAGGATRQETVQRLGKETHGEIVLLHDVARPFFSPEHCLAVCGAAAQYGAAALAVAVAVRDSLCLDEDGFAGPTVDRSRLVAIQTPQAFRAELFRDVLARAETANWAETSMVLLFRRAGYRVRLIPGDAGNEKITYPADWEAARHRIENL